MHVHDPVHSYACTTASPVICDPETPMLDHAAGILELDQSVALLGGSPGERRNGKHAAGSRQISTRVNSQAATKVRRGSITGGPISC